MRRLHVAFLLMSCVEVGCASVAIDAEHSLNPVMLGPVLHFSAEQEETPRTTLRLQFDMKNKSFGAAGPDGHSYHHDKDSENKFDIVIEQRSRSVFSRYVVDEIRCNGTGSYHFFFGGAETVCSIVPLLLQDVSPTAEK